MTGDAPAGWQGILEPGETILWQGRPNAAMTFHAATVVITLFGLAFSGFALVWMLLAYAAGGWFWMVGLLHFTAGLVVVWLGLFHDAWRRRRSYYTLTSRRAIIASSSFSGEKWMKSYPITAQSEVSLRPDGAFATLVFHTDHWRDSDGDARTTDVGFERLGDGQQVLDLMRQIQTAVQ